MQRPKIQRVLALAGCVALAGLYVATLLCAIFARENVMNVMMASVYATIIIPVLIWACGFLYRLMHRDDGNGGEPPAGDDGSEA